MNDPNPAIRRMADWFVSMGTPIGINCWNDTYAEITRLRAELKAETALCEKLADALELKETALAAMTAERDASRATAQRLTDAYLNATKRLKDDAPLTPAEAMARCPDVAALVEAARAKALEDVTALFDPAYPEGRALIAAIRAMKEQKL